MTESPSPPPSTADPPESVLRLARSGEAGAVDALARWCYPRVYRWALVHTGDADDADDVTQEVVVALAGRLGGFRGDARFTSWLYRVTANAAEAQRRKRRRRAATLLRWWRPAGPSDEEHRRLEELHGERLAGLVRVLLHELPPQQRMVFDLADLQDLGTEEIAAMLDLEAATVRGHLMRARRTLRERMPADLPSLREDRP